MHQPYGARPQATVAAETAMFDAVEEPIVKPRSAKGHCDVHRLRRECAGASTQEAIMPTIKISFEPVEWIQESRDYQDIEIHGRHSMADCKPASDCDLLLDGIYALEMVDNMKCRSCNNRSAIFMTVPAAATSTMSRRGAWSELKLIGIGLACQKEMARGTTAENQAIGSFQTDQCVYAGLKLTQRTVARRGICLRD